MNRTTIPGFLLLFATIVFVYPDAGRAQVVSPVVHATGQVTFRTIAPNATRVLVKGLAGVEPQEMSRTDNGAWEVTVGPLAPELYSYVFEVDGADQVDRLNRDIKTWFWLESLVEVPGDPPLLHERQPTPHGIVHHHTYPSDVADREQGLFVYTPPGYSPTRESGYPVLVLLHGYGDDESAWVDVGRAPIIADNLIAKGQMIPMIIAMPYGHPIAVGSGGYGDDYGRANQMAMETRIVDEILPALGRDYHVADTAALRAIAGLSMGGGQSLAIGLRNLDLFSYVGGFSSATPDADRNDYFSGITGDVDAANDRLNLLWISCGRDDFLLQRNNAFAAWLGELGVDHVYEISEGGHDWMVWRRYLQEYLPMLFR